MLFVKLDMLCLINPAQYGIAYLCVCMRACAGGGPSLRTGYLCFPICVDQWFGSPPVIIVSKMDMLANSFSLLELDQEDAKEQVETAMDAADSRKRRGLNFPR